MPQPPGPDLAATPGREWYCLPQSTANFRSDSAAASLHQKFESKHTLRGIHCSRDLKQVLDGCGGDSVIEQCNADQGCGNTGKCVDACTAAAQTKGSAGCDFWTVPPVAGSYRGSCFAAMIANTWDRPVTVRAALGNDPLDISASVYTVTRTDRNPVYTQLKGPIPPGEVGVIFLS